MRGSTTERELRAILFAVLANDGCLFVLNLLVNVVARDRLVQEVHQVYGRSVLIVSGVAVVVMTAAVVIFGTGNHDDVTGARRNH